MKKVLMLLLLALFLSPAGTKAQNLNATTTHDRVWGVIEYDENRGPAEGEIRFFDKNTGIQVSSAIVKGGQYEILLPKKGAYYFNFYTDIFVFYFNQPANAFSTSTDAILSNLNLSFNVMRYGKGAQLEIPALIFASHSAEITPELQAVLDQFAAAFKSTGGGMVQAAGHASDEADENANKTLSKQRAQAVVTYLTDKGLPAEMFLSYGYGSTRPVSGTEKFAAANQRVSFIVIQPAGATETETPIDPR